MGNDNDDLGEDRDTGGLGRGDGGDDMPDPKKERVDQVGVDQVDCSTLQSPMPNLKEEESKSRSLRSLTEIGTSSKDSSTNYSSYSWETPTSMPQTGQRLPMHYPILEKENQLLEETSG